MTVYVDLVFAENFLVDYFVLRTVAATVKIKAKHPLAASVLGGVLACVFPMFRTYGTIIKFASLFVTVALCFGISKNVFILLAHTGINTCALYGIVSFMAQSIRLNILAIACVSIAVSMFLGFLTRVIIKKNRIRSFTATLILNDRKINAIVDSGNSLTYKGKPVIILSDREFEFSEMPVLIPYTTVSGEGVLIGYEVKNVKAELNERVFELDCYVAVSNKKCFGNAEAILNPAAIRGWNIC